MSEVHYVRLFTGADGESHFEDAVVGLTLTNAAPPAPPFGVSEWQSAERMGFISFPPDWRSDLHPTPQRTCVVCIAGSCVLQASDGEIRHVRIGDVTFVEDTTGKGHRTWIEGNETYLAATIQLRD